MLSPGADYAGASAEGGPGMWVALLGKVQALSEKFHILLALLFGPQLPPLLLPYRQVMEAAFSRCCQDR